MKVIDILMTEHQVILSKLNEMEALASQSRQLQVDEIQDLINFFQIFADAYHHKKEEDILFVWMREMNPMVEHGPLACMLKEHDQGRASLLEALDLMDKQEFGDSLKSVLQQFCDNLRQHIEKEDNVLYSIARQLEINPGDGDAAMLDEFMRVNEREKNSAWGLISSDAQKELAKFEVVR